MNSIDYRVRSGDTLTTIARRHKVSVEVLSRLNGLGDIDRLWAGQTLKIPTERPPATRSAPQSVTYRIRAGETLSDVAQRHKVTVDALAQANGLTDPDRVTIGHVLTIPAMDSSTPRTTGKKGAGVPLSQSSSALHGITRSQGTQRHGTDGADEGLGPGGAQARLPSPVQNLGGVSGLQP